MSVFACVSWIMNDHKNLEKEKSVQDKQNLRVAFPISNLTQTLKMLRKMFALLGIQNYIMISFVNF